MLPNFIMGLENISNMVAKNQTKPSTSLFTDQNLSSFDDLDNCDGFSFLELLHQVDRNFESRTPDLQETIDVDDVQMSLLELLSIMNSSEIVPEQLVQTDQFDSFVKHLTAKITSEESNQSNLLDSEKAAIVEKVQSLFADKSEFARHVHKYILKGVSEQNGQSIISKSEPILPKTEFDLVKSESDIRAYTSDQSKFLNIPYEEKLLRSKESSKDEVITLFRKDILSLTAQKDSNSIPIKVFENTIENADSGKKTDLVPKNSNVLIDSKRSAIHEIKIASKEIDKPFEASLDLLKKDLNLNKKTNLQTTLNSTSSDKKSLNPQEQIHSNPVELESQATKFKFDSNFKDATLNREYYRVVEKDGVEKIDVNQSSSKLILNETYREELPESKVTLGADKVSSISTDSKPLIKSPSVNYSDIIQQVVEKAKISSKKEHNEITIKLKPEVLGKIHLNISTENQHVTIKIMADSSAVKEILENNLYHLKSGFSNQGLEIGSFDVFVGDDTQDFIKNQNFTGFQQHRRRMAQEKKSGSEAAEKDENNDEPVSEPEDTSKDRIDYYV